MTIKTPNSNLAGKIRSFSKTVFKNYSPPTIFKNEEDRLKDLVIEYISNSLEIYGSLLQKADQDMRIRSNNISIGLSKDYNNHYFGSYEAFKKLIHSMDSFFSFIKTKGIVEKHPLFTKDFRDNGEFYLERITEGKAKIHEMAHRPAFAIESDIALLVHEWLNLSDKENIPLRFFDKFPPYYRREAEGIMTRLGWKGGFEPVLMY